MHINFKATYVLILLLAGCSEKQKTIRENLYITKKESSKPLDKESKYITIWIHGTKLIPRPILHKIFHSPDGLVPATAFDSQYHLRSIADTLCAADQVKFASEYTFLFGWSGQLGFESREKAAQDLYKQLKPVIKAYIQKHKARPLIRIITHSHGGNVALNLAKIKDDQDFVIDELILLACPVQEATAELIKDKIFKEVFVIYSAFDLLQIIDPQGLYSYNNTCPLLSKRHFPIQDNIIQTKIKINGRALLHCDFIRLKFIAILPQIIDKMRELHKQCSCKKCLTQEQTQQLLSIHT
jgi:hypothetical protein